MCGIFGFAISAGTNLRVSELKEYTDTLFRLSESRGKEAAGCAIRVNGSILVYKKPLSASAMIASDAYRKFFKKAVLEVSTRQTGTIVTPLTMIGHSRLVTNGVQEMNENNQPVIKDEVVGVHNGIIVNDEKLWRQFPQLRKAYDVDTEVLLTLLRYFFDKKKSLEGSVREVFGLLQGSASVAVLFSELKHLLLATNTGSLYISNDTLRRIFVFASELFILKEFLGGSTLERKFGRCDISQIKPGYGFLIDAVSLEWQEFSFRGVETSFVEVEKTAQLYPKANIVDISENLGTADIFRPTSINWAKFEGEIVAVERQIDLLMRCSRCVLPSSFPFIEFDSNGVCNYCRNYVNIEVMGEDALFEMADRYRKRKGSFDCIVCLSGGRDSSYGLHYVKNVLRMNPLAFSYDWGMITDLGRRNQARLCGSLGVEHILVSADIRKKREYIRKNVEAWLKKPDLGLIPLFMAGDKQYFYYANKLMKQYGTSVLVMAENQLERAHFKHGFCGVKYKATDQPLYKLSLSDRMRIVYYYGKQYMINPAYINASLLDTVGAYISYYLIPHNYLYLFNYIRWNEEKIMSILRKEYDWELAIDTHSTWRIGDGTAAFYNYIYYVVAGFTEIDAFRSNQVREGMITREQALKLAKEENRPRFESIEWYAQTIGFDCERAIHIINSIPKLYCIDR